MTSEVRHYLKEQDCLSAAKHKLKGVEYSTKKRRSILSALLHLNIVGIKLPF